MERFGQDLSPEARQKLSDEAERQKHSFSVVGGGLLSGLGDVIAGRRPSDEPLQKKRAQIDEDTTGRFDKAKELVLRDLAASDKLEDRERLRTIQGREDTAYGRGEEDLAKNRDPNDPRAADAREMIKWASGKIGLPASNLDSLGIEQLSKHPFYGKAAELWEKEKMANRPAAMGGYGPGDAPFLNSVFDMARGIKPPDAPIDTHNVSPKALQNGITGAGAAKGRDNTQNRFATLRGKPLQDYTSMAQVLTNLDGISAKLPGWDTGFLKNKANRLAWYAGMDDPKRAAINTQLGLNLADYIKSISGTAVNENERAFLTSITPNADTDEDTLYENLNAFQDYVQHKMDTTLNADQTGGYNVGPARGMAEQKGWLAPAAPETAPAAAPKVAPAAPPAGAHPEDINALLDKYK